MKPATLLKRFRIYAFLAIAMSFSSVRAQVIDTTNIFDPPLTDVHMVYAEIVYHAVNGNTNLDCGFALSPVEIVAFGDYATNVAFYDEGLAVRNQAVGGFVRTNVIVPVPGEVIKLWIVVNVPDMTYRAYAQTGDMTEPLVIYDGDATFRNTNVGSGLNRWTAFHYGNDDYLTVDNVSLVTDSDPTLKSLSANVGVFDNEFDPLIYDYALDVPFGTTTIQLDAVPNGLGAQVEMFDGLGNSITNGLVSFSGDGVDVEIIVTAFDGTQLTYYVAIYVGEGQSDARLSAIEVSTSALDPLFNPDVFDYTLIVPVGTSSVDITPTPFYAGAAVSGGGTVTLSGGAATESIVVTSADASETNTYTINVVEADGKNYALSLPGDNGLLSNVDISGFPLNSFPYTIEMWFKPEGVQPYNAGLIFQREHNVGLQYVSSWQTPRDRVRFMTGIADNYGTTSGNIVADAWHHLAVVLTDSFRIVYLDGVMNSEKIASPVLDWADGKIYLGWDMQDNAKAFKGLIDEVRIWNDSLGADQLKDNKLAVLNGDEPNLVGYWNFDLNASSVAIDLTDTRHGVITGGTYVGSFPRVNLDLDTLYVDGYSFKPGFITSIQEYYLVLDQGTTTVNIAATADEPTATVSGTGSVSVDAESGTFIVTVSSGDGSESKDYSIHYVVDTDLTLMHSYTFADGTARDVVAGADGDIQGGVITDGAFTSEENGDFIILPAQDIALNTYPSITLETWVTPHDNTNYYAMLAYFGGLEGNNSLWIQIAREDEASRFQLSTGDVTNINTLEPGPFENHHYVGVLTFDTIYFYVDGALIGKQETSDNSLISKIDPSNGWLCDGGYAADPTWLGTMYEFNIYSGAMNAQTVLAHSINFPLEDGTQDATLSDLTVDGMTIEGFAPYRLGYEMTLDAGVTDVPVVAATTTRAAASAVVNAATEVPGTTSVVVTAEDGTTVNTYTVDFLKGKSSVATLSDLRIDGVTVEGFFPEVITYYMELPYGTTQVPVVEATTTDPNATYVVNNPPSVPGTTTVVVTAEDGFNKETYTIGFSVMDAIDDHPEDFVKVYPSVSGGSFTVATGGGMNTISVYNMAGVKVWNARTENTETEITTPGPGVYILKVETGNAVRTFRIVHTR